MSSRTRTQPRLIVPDLARGFALLGIAVANVSQTWIINEYNDDTQLGTSLGGIRPDSTIDQVTALFAAMFVHVRGLPMFSTLLGFGLGLVAASLHRKGYPAARAKRIIARRYFFLALFGVAHLVLVFHGDIMTLYGLIGIVVALCISASTKALRIAAYSILGLSTVGSALIAAVMAYFEVGAAELGSLAEDTATMTSLGTYFRENAMFGLLNLTGVAFASIPLVGLVLLGFVWAREGYLVDVDTHRRLLVTWVGVAAAVVLVVGIPLGLSAIGVINPAYEMPLYVLNQGVGLFTGPGILAGLALVTHPLQRRMYREFEATGEAKPPAWTYPFVALGKRSMTGYMLQSFFFIALVMPFSLSLGLHSSITGKSAVGCAVWVLTLLVATGLEAAGKQGPFEYLHRRASYGRTGRVEPYRPPVPSSTPPALS